MKNQRLIFENKRYNANSTFYAMWKQIDRSGLKIGDFVNYAPTSGESYTVLGKYSGFKNDITYTVNLYDYKWRIFSINSDGTVDLVLTSSSVGYKWTRLGQQDLSFYLEGAVGYNNGVYLLNEVCKKLYSNTKLGIEARSINIDDWAKYWNGKIEYDTTSTSLNTVYYRYDEDDTSSSMTNVTPYYPAIYKYEKGAGINSKVGNKNGISPSDSYYNSPTTSGVEKVNSYLTITSNYVSKATTTDLTNSFIYDICMNSNTSWTATRFVRAFRDKGSYYLYEFGLYYGGLRDCALFGIYDCDSSGDGGGYISNSGGKNICPIVRIPATINITLSNGTNGASNMHTIDGL